MNATPQINTSDTSARAGVENTWGKKLLQPRSARNLETFRSFAGVAPPDRDPAGTDSRISLAAIGLRSSTDTLRGVEIVGVEGEGRL